MYGLLKNILLIKKATKRIKRELRAMISLILKVYFKGLRKSRLGGIPLVLMTAFINRTKSYSSS
ncbi:hypothetical protein CANDROIZ_670003 [Candidatus Roizmanbacteria bacterium]|nr:hypothetical protein CANDROIZ_670003 [Candidatus Roizmanbacteria bacterium]